MNQPQPGRLTLVAADGRGAWAAMADDFRALAQICDQLDQQNAAPAHSANVYFSFDLYLRPTPEHIAAVETIAGAIDVEPETEVSGRGPNRRGMRKAKGKLGRVSLIASAAVQLPPTKNQTRKELEDENARLRSLLEAQGGQP